MVRFVEDRSDRLGRPVFLHKFTGWPRAGFLRACFPDAIFVEVVRDGRAVANSWLQMAWWLGHHGPDQWHFGPLPPDLQWLWEESDRSFPVLAALGWRLLMASYDDARAAGPRGLVAAGAVRGRARRTGGGVRRDARPRWGWTGRPAFEAGFARYTFSSGRADAFRRDLSVADLAAMEAVLDKPLELLGYR